MSLLQRQAQSQRLQQRADPQLLLTNRILQMSTLELRQCVLHELAENPALESTETGDCGNCEFAPVRCVTCPHSGMPLRLDAGVEADDAAFQRTAGVAPDLDLDPLARVESPTTLREHLLDQLHAHGRGETLLHAGRFLVANIADDGYLRCTVEDAAEFLQLPTPAVESALSLVQTFDPLGVGARTLHECLLIQARALVPERSAPVCLVRLLTECWKEVGASKWEVAAKRLRVSVDEVERAVVWLRGNLSPYPGQKYCRDWGETQRSANWVRPDVVVQRDELGSISLELARDEAPTLHINPEYTRLWDQMRARPEAFGVAERKHLQEYLFRAQMFLKSMKDRTSILRQVAECVLSEQERYFHSEREEDMLPLTQSQLASFLRVHESTVSRAIADKFLQLPSGRVVAISYFFDRALSHRALVANVVASENPSAPFSDQQIADLLRRQGVIIARRTVMKYREEMNILSSRQRGRAASA
ncbi:MAG: RNA polymerase factor sigma-54 [Actinomycetota bacterium]